jgi:exodeoxyribonuclease VII large subunit
MSRATKSQWDFGELFPLEATRKVLTVSQLTTQVKSLLENQIGQVWVSGEVTNLRAQSSGHLYFTLKDATAQVSCVLFRGEAQPDRSLLEDGRKILVQGDVTVYEARGQYQLIVRAVELQGIGALQAAFEKLKQKLNAEGLFAPERKRPLPQYPQRLGLVTSPTGAAIRDVLHVVRRRHAGLAIILAPCRVQGPGAAEEIAAAIRLLNEFSLRGARGVAEGRLLKASELRSTSKKTPLPNPLPFGRGEGEDSARASAGFLNSMAVGRLDLILVTRGGGSLEDLWAFNEEVVARAIFESALPVVSAIGHEIDFTISDFVADLRAATPSAAAEIITQGVFASYRFLAEAGDRLGQLCHRQMDGKADGAARLTHRLARLHPRRRFNEWLQRLDDLQSSLSRCAKQSARHRRLLWQHLRERIARLRPRQLLEQRRELLRQEQRRLCEQARHRLQNWQNRLATLDTRLRLLGPEQVLARGYSITMDAATGKVLRSAAGVKTGQKLKTRLKAGEVRSRVEN